MLLTWGSLVQLCFLASVHPYIKQAQNRLEILNELCIYLSTFLMLVFCNVSILDEAKMLLGWLYIVIVSMGILMNLGVSTFKSVKDLIKLIKSRSKE